MSIILPDNSDTSNMTMTSVGVQADVNDPEGILGVIRSFREQMVEIQQLNQTLIDLKNARQSKLDTTTTLSERLSEQIDDLIRRAETTESILHDDKSAIDAYSKELEDLINENERLELEVGGHEVHVTAKDLEMEQRLTGFVEADLDERMETLASLHRQLADTLAECDTQWHEIKAETLQTNEEVLKHEAMLEHLHELKLARCAGSNSDAEFRSLVQRMISYHDNQMEQKLLLSKLMEARLQERDMEFEIGQLTREKRDLWRRCLDLENLLEEITGTEDQGNMLRPAAAYSDLPDIMNERLPRATSDTDLTDEQVHHGRLLHRCTKATHLVVDMSDEEADTEHLESAVGQRASTDDVIDDVTQGGDEEHPQERETNQEEPSPETEPEVPPDVPTQRELSEQSPEASFINKLRKRVGGISRTASQRFNTGFRLAASGSMRQFNQANFMKRRK
ncbi:paramyosin-like isoform X2 [Dreissena polymorpha]|uniref:paramyosin-like isoform X2 n=1 Tax=Dreissena polymorpha TaxID=45954 RepID=UPI0022653471|nr:paramyosin-like isoform X2 [Dreissena polymorpha]